MTDDATTTETTKRPDERPWWKKKRFLIPLALVLLIAIGGALGGEEAADDDVASDDTTTTEAEPDEEEPDETTTTTAAPTTTTAPPEPAPQHLEGGGQAATDLIEIEGGMTVFNLGYQGGGNFAVWLQSEEAENIALLANHIGGYQGSYGEHVPAGRYRLDVTASGPWTIDILQPRPASGDPIPHEYSGSSDGVVGPFEADGAVRFEMTYQGDGNFAVWSLHEDGRPRDLLANEIGAFQGSKAGSFEGLYWLRVTASGPWTVRLGE